ncbi:hypothetical protein BC938DRAFT_483340 [Jimgerdemannia flammicorona]|uniref:MACPF domain-containing protein n=1 Tax=Jimgerdemannia flammicorona TaxID=994334 RepID=A0A433QC42_9FUNG|nr:hypothetical protein BC938DRAFT_483340 [Jimgerdemannia flammicorona]
MRKNTQKEKKSSDRLSVKDIPPRPSSAASSHHEDSPKKHRRAEKAEKVDIQGKEFTDKIFDLSRTYTVEGKAALATGVRLKAGELLALRAFNEIREEELVSRSELTESLIDNGFNQASVKFLFPLVTTELDGSRVRTDRSMRTDHKSSYYRVIYYYQASMKLTKNLVEPTPALVERVRTALALANTSEKYKALQEVFREFGYVWAQNVILGGRITVSEIITEHQSDREKKTSAFAEAKASVSGTITGFGKAGFGAGFTTQSDRGSNNAADFSNQRSRLRIIGRRNVNLDHAVGWFDVADHSFLPPLIHLHPGGRPTADTLEDRTSWQKSLQLAPSTWEVILRDELIPIYELLDPELSTQVKGVMEASLNEERITSQMKLNLRNVETKFSLGWKKLYYGHSKGNNGMVVATCPQMSGEDNATMLWMMVKRPSNDDKSPYIRFGDIVYIQPAAGDKNDKKLFLHGSHRQDAPLTKGAPEVSLRYFPNGPNENDEWTIVPCDDHPGAEIDLDTTMRKTMYLTKDDHFKLRHKVTDNHYLSSHKVTIECIRVRRNPNEPNPAFSLFPPMLKDKRGLGSLASKLNEVLMLDASQVEKEGGSPDLWEIILI